MCRPATGIVQAKPVTPQPPSSSDFTRIVGGSSARSRRRESMRRWIWSIGLLLISGSPAYSE